MTRINATAASLVFVVLLGVTQAESPRLVVVQESALDLYGGYRNLPAPGGATGVFRLEKIGNRWTFVTPAGNAFWLRAVYDMGGARGGTRYRNALAAKYPAGDTGANQSMKRLRAWGFNAIGEYANMHWLPIGTYGSAGIAEKLPFLFVMNGSYYGMKAPDGTKNIFLGVNRSANPSIYIGRFADVFDPRFAVGWSQVVASQLAAFNGGASAVDASPWYIGSTTDDGDYTTGFGPGPDGASSQGKIHPHLGWIAAVTNPAQAGYTDTKVHIKYALRDFLARKYGTVAALNAAWGSTYTTFDSAGGWGTGTGFLDEDGRHAWIGTNDGNYLKTASAGAKADLDTFLGQIATRYFSVSAAAIRAALPHHLVFSPASMQAGTRAQILQAAGPYLDAIQSSGVPLGSSYPLYQKAYNLTGKPLFIWTAFTAQADADLLGTIPPGWGTGYYDHPTQGARGIAYAKDISGLLNLQGADGAFFVAGIDWWEWTDTTTSGENMNFGLVTNLDNVYDGKEAVVSIGTDSAGRQTGGQRRNYGDFLSSVRAAHHAVEIALQAGMPRSRMEPANVTSAVARETSHPFIR